MVANLFKVSTKTYIFWINLFFVANKLNIQKDIAWNYSIKSNKKNYVNNNLHRNLDYVHIELI